MIIHPDGKITHLKDCSTKTLQTITGGTFDCIPLIDYKIPALIALQAESAKEINVVASRLVGLAMFGNVVIIQATSGAFWCKISKETFNTLKDDISKIKEM